MLSHARRFLPGLLVATTACALVACTDGGGADISGRRDEVVTASGPPRSSSAGTLPSAPVRRGPMCKPGRSGLKPKSVKMASVQAPNEQPLGDELTLAEGKWTWINVWAGWCDPCVQEIPLLEAWEKRLAPRLAVEFVSVDDDDRLAVRFLSSQPEGGVRRSHHIGDLDVRKEWLESMGASMAKLPIQILVDPKGEVRCAVNGAVMESDFAEIAALVK